MQGQVKTGFILSIISGALVALQGLLHIIRSQWGLELGLGELRRHSLRGIDIKVLGIVTLILGIMILLGALLMRSGRVREGAITVIAFSILTISAGGGYFIGVILGVIGGTLALGYHLGYHQPKENPPELKQK
jgi:hypothetical protein